MSRISFLTVIDGMDAALKSVALSGAKELGAEVGDRFIFCVLGWKEGLLDGAIVVEREGLLLGLKDGEGVDLKVDLVGSGRNSIRSFVGLTEG